MASSVDLARLRAADLLPLVEQAFVLRPPGGGEVRCTLLAVDELHGAPPSGAVPEGGRSPFSAVWCTAREVVLPQAIYRLEHPALGTLDVFIVPLGADASGMRYEAIFA